MSRPALAGEAAADVDGATSVSVAGLRLIDFRNYADLDLRLGAEHVVLVGENGAGKTNLMEAVSLMSPGRGLRRATIEEARWTQQQHQGGMGPNMSAPQMGEVRALSTSLFMFCSTVRPAVMDLVAI